MIDCYGGCWKFLVCQDWADGGSLGAIGKMVGYL